MIKKTILCGALILSAAVWSAAGSKVDIDPILSSFRKNPGLHSAVTKHIQFLSAAGRKLSLTGTIYDLTTGHPFMTEQDNQPTFIIHASAQALALAIAEDKSGETFKHVERALGQETALQLKSFKLTETEIIRIRENLLLGEQGAEDIGASLDRFARFFENQLAKWDQAKASQAGIINRDFAGHTAAQLQRSETAQRETRLQKPIEKLPVTTKAIRGITEIIIVLAPMFLVVGSFILAGLAQFPQTLAQALQSPANMAILASTSIFGIGIGMLAARLSEVADKSKRYPAAVASYPTFLAGCAIASVVSRSVGGPLIMTAFGFSTVVAALLSQLNRSKDRTVKLALAIVLAVFIVAGFVFHGFDFRAVDASDFYYMGP